MGKKRGRKAIGDRVTFACPDDLFQYVTQFGRQVDCDGWSDALRRLIRDHRKKSVCGKSSKLDSGDFIQ